MPNSYFQFKEFRVEQVRSGMKVTTEACLFGAWCTHYLMQNKLSPSQVLDIGTGTGLLSLMIAQKFPSIEIDAVEIQEDSYLEALENFRNSKWCDNLNTFHCDISAFQQKEHAYDIIICNPPFFSNSQKGIREAKNIAIYAEHLSLSKLVFHVDRLLGPEGIFFVLLPVYQMEQFQELIAKVDLHLCLKILIHEKVGKDPFRIMCSFGRDRIKISGRNSIIIKTNPSSYTMTFRNLLKDFYLKL